MKARLAIPRLTAALLAPAFSLISQASPPAPKPSGPALVMPRNPEGSGKVDVTGELKQWHKISLTLDGPFAAEIDNDPNPFTDCNFTVTFTHESGTPSPKVPGFFAADGDAANSSAGSGTKWRANLSPDKTGTWNYAVSFTEGKDAALGGGGVAIKPFDGLKGSFTVAPSDKSGRDFRAQGRLQYVGKHHLQFAGSKQYFLKAGPDAPETLLAYADFDNTRAGKSNILPLKTWGPHVGDWKPGDPTWGDGKGKGLTGAMTLQNPWRSTHQRTLQWLRESAAAGRPWVVANDEQNPAGLGVPPDPGYKGHDGIAVEKTPKGSKAEGNFTAKPYTMHDIRKFTLWGNLMAGGAGVEYYFGYQLPQNDLNCEDFRARDKSWDYCRTALDFFRDNRIPFWEMQNADALIGNSKNDNSRFCFAKAGELYLVYLPNGGETQIDLAGTSGEFDLKWFNPREGGAPKANGAATLNGGRTGTLSAPSADDWLAIIVKK